MSCPSDEQLGRFLEDRLEASERETLREHVAHCKTCKEIVEQLAPSEGEEPVGPAERKAAGTRLGRYVVERELGAGAMGVVYLARDPKLDRSVALKVLRPERLLGQEQKRLLREARLTAKLSHPNVITVYDVGEDQGQLFLAMEYVPGTTLRQWLAEAERTTEDILEMFVAVAAGLHAAHEAGIVHRDFKPDNVLVSSGRPRVADFGLAGIARVAERTLTESLHGTPPSSKSALTQTGLILGTPAYMAPEQTTTSRVTPRSDQFAFCVALWEALYGSRPFAGRSAAELADNARKGNLLGPAPSRIVPRRVQKALLRGLSARPEDRFPSLAALASTLSPPSKRRFWRVVGVVAGALVATGIVVRSSVKRESVRVCQGMEQELSAVWNQTQRKALHDNLEAAKLDAPTIQRVLGNVDVYAAAWVAGSRDACESARVRRSQTEVQLELRTACLTLRKAELAALIAALQRPDVDVGDKALEVSLRLPSLTSCADLPGLALRGPTPPEAAQAPKVEALRARLRDAWALQRAYALLEASNQAAVLVQEARALGYRPLIAETLLLLGETVGDNKERPAVLSEAAWLAEASHHDSIAARAWVALYRSSLRSDTPAASESSWERATSAVARLEGDPPQKAALLVDLAESRLLYDPARARQLASEALSIRASPQGQESLDDLRASKVVARAAAQLEDAATAEAELRRVSALVVRLFGVPDPEIEFETARLLAFRGSFDEAQEKLGTALALTLQRQAHIQDRARRLASDPKTRWVVVNSVEVAVWSFRGLQIGILDTRGDVHLAKGDWKAAEEAYREALAEAERYYGKKELAAVRPLVGLSCVSRSRQELDRALGYAQDALRAAAGESTESAARGSALLELAFVQIAKRQTAAASATLGLLPKEPTWPPRQLAARALALAQVQGATDKEWAAQLQSAEEYLAKAGRLADVERRQLAALRAR